MPTKILIIDDEPAILEVFSEVLKDDGYSVATAATAQEGLEQISFFQPDILFLDVWLPDGDGVKLLGPILQQHPGLMVVMISGHGHIEMAVGAVKAGAWDFVEKPLSMDRINILIDKILLHKKNENEKNHLLRQKKQNFIVQGQSSEMVKIKSQLHDVARSQSIVIQGLKGVGKTHLAKSCHYFSGQARKNFIEITPRCLNESPHFFDSLSEFVKLKACGSLHFLDLDLLSPTQLKALEKLLLSNESQSLNIRVSAECVQDTRLLNLFEQRVKLPELKERPEDIPLLMEHFTRLILENSTQKTKSYSSDLMNRIVNATWPGQVRELKNFMERIYLLHESDFIEAKDLELLWKY